MQLFNGLNMWILSSYKINNEENHGENPSIETYENSKNEQLNKIKNEIKELTDGKNTDNDKIEIQWILTTEFVNYLNSNKDVAIALNDAVKKIDYNNLDDDNKKAVDNLKKFLEPIVNKSFSDTYKISEIKNIEPPSNNEKGEFASWVDKAPDWLDSAVKKLLDDIGTKFSNYESILNGENNKDIKTTLEKVKMVLDNPVEKNVKFLQKVIYDNLDDGNKNKFLLENKNKKNYNENDKFDWKFWKHMVEWTQKWLNIIEDNLKRLKDAQDVISESEKNNLLWKVKPDIQADASSDPKNWFNDLPKWTEVKFKDDGEKQKLNTVWDNTEIKLIVTTNGVSEEISVKVKVVEKVQATPTTPETTKTSTTPVWPLEITRDGQDEQHLVATDNVAKKFNSPLYCLGVWPEVNPEKNDKIDNSGDREYLMKINDGSYIVKLDQNGNLKPLAINYKSGVEVLLKDNPSCIAYLKNKVQGLPGNPDIVWYPPMQDYIIKSYNKALTIEPMILDGEWVSKDISQCLAFENLSNFLRWNWNIYDLEFKNNNPDLKLETDGLYVRVKKWAKLRDGTKSGKWQKIYLEEFWIRPDDVEALKKFIKYNNHEDWNDNWDKKSKNKWYVKIDFPNVSAQVAVSAPASDSSNSSASNLNNSVVSSNDLYSSWVAQSVVEGGSVDQSGVKLNEVVVMSTIFKPKNPIIWVGAWENEWDIGSKKDVNFDGLWKFESGKFTFDANVIWNDGKMSIDEKFYDKVNIEGWIFVGWDKKAFTWEWYYLWDIIRDKNNSGENNIKYLYYGGYKDWLRSWQWTRVFENGAKYEWEWKEWKEEWIWKYTYTNGDTYEWAFVDGKFEWNWTFTFKESWITVDWEFKDNKLVSWNVTLNWQYYQVERDEKWLKIITKWENYGKYIDLAKWSIKSVSVVDDVKWDKKVDNASIDATSPVNKSRIDYANDAMFWDLGVNIELGTKWWTNGAGAEIPLNDEVQKDKEINELDLSKYENFNWNIDLSQLTTLTKDQAKILATTSWTLNLDWLKSIDSDIAQELIKHGWLLSLNWIESLSKEVADKFNNHGWTLSFDWIKKFDVWVSDFIWTSEWWLSLAGLEEISDDDARNLWKHVGVMIHEFDSLNNTITLSSLKHLTPNQAKLLWNFEWEVQLTWLKELDNQVAEALAKSKLSQIYFDNQEFDTMVRKINPWKIPNYIDL